MNIKTTVIFDLDGTLALVDKRREIAKKPNGKIDFDIFYDPQYIELDEPNSFVIELAKMYKRNGYEIVIVSGRSDRTKEATERWLEKYGILYDRMIMRKR